MKNWPKKGSKITYNGVNKAFWFTNIIENAEKNLEVGKEYTVAKLHLASSWCGVELEETGDTEYALGFFTYPKELTTSEVKAGMPGLKLKKHTITRQDYYYECDDRCCTEYGGSWKLDGKEVYKGPDEDEGWLAVLVALSCRVELINLNEAGETVSETDNYND